MRKSLIELLAIRLSEQITHAKSLVILKLLGIAAALTLSTCVSAVGMGGINVASALGQPLKADIELVAVNKSEKASLVARLASPDVYKGAGLEYPSGNKFIFQVENRADGEPYLKVNSAQPINDPFVSILVELTWSSGKLLREYTFLLDPPGYAPEQPKPAEVQAVAPVVQPAPAEAVKPAERAAPAAIMPGADKPAASARGAAKAVEQPARKPVMAAPDRQAATEPAAMNAATGSITVQRGDTLNKIAAQNKPAEVSLERMLVALYRANADQFDGKNMNRIKTGKILHLPDQNELMSVAQSDAAKEIRAQAADWNAYRQKLAGAAATATGSQPQAARQIATGKVTSSVADKTPVAKESAREVLKLSKGEAPGDKAAAGAAGKPITVQDKKNAAQEEAIATAKTAREERARAELLEKNLKDMQRLAKLKSDVAARAQSASPAASVIAAASPVAAASSVEAASAVKPARARTAKPKPEVVAPQPSLVDQILGEPLYLAGGAAALLGLVGLGFMLNRRKQATGEDMGAIGHIATPAAPSPDTGDFTTSVAAVSAENVQSDDVDPISEAELFLNFGRDAQAEEILKEALQNTPNNHQIHLKLLGIYANRKDVNSFSAIARQLQDSGDEEAWQQAAAMGRKLEPDNPAYGSAGTIEDTDSAIMQTAAPHAVPDFILDDMPAAQETPAPDVDFDLGALSDVTTGDSTKLSEDDSQAAGYDVTTGETTSHLTDETTGETTSHLTRLSKDDSQVAGYTEAAPLPEQDFIGGAEITAIMSPEDMAAAQSAPADFDVTSTDLPFNAPGVMDFDITSTSPSTPATIEQAEAELPNLDDLIFDVTSTHQPTPAAQPEAGPVEAVQADDGGMAFTLDFPVEDGAAKSAPATQPAEVDFAGINLNFDDIAAPTEPAPENRGESWHEVATKLDLARAYQEMGDATGAREILEEVLREGDAGQREAAQFMLDQLG